MGDRSHNLCVISIQLKNKMIFYRILFLSQLNKNVRNIFHTYFKPMCATCESYNIEFVNFKINSVNQLTLYVLPSTRWPSAEFVTQLFYHKCVGHRGSTDRPVSAYREVRARATGFTLL